LAGVAREVGLQWASDGEHVLLSWSRPGQEMRLYRSTQPFDRTDLANPTVPITPFGGLGTANTFLDYQLAPGTEYFYAGLTPDGCWFTANPVQLPCQDLPEELDQPWILVDKVHYILKLYSHGKIAKKYPIALGGNPHRRKLVQDRASTPEGRYQISGVQPKAKWYKAYDINYPNRADRARHKLLAPSSPIGGEIQIHGGGIEDNWTWGCIAMRNQDIDELFDYPEIGRGTVVWVVGRELSYQDLECDEEFEGTDPVAIGRWQQSNKLPVSCLFDRATRAQQDSSGKARK
jgi:lipoprotein-anchoring transpeptidase ErfK/SrfK